MNLLIVGRQIDEIRTISQMLNWSALQINQIFSAQSDWEAQNRIRTDIVDILLYSTEYVRDGKSELLRWIEREKLDISCVCMANKDDPVPSPQFKHHFIMYKPIDPDELNCVLAEETKKRNVHKSSYEIHQFLRLNRNDIMRQFWQNLFYGEIPSNHIAIQDQIDSLHLPLDTNWSYCPLLVVVRNWGQDLEDDHRLNRYGVHNVVVELFQQQAEKLGLWWTVFPFGQHGQMTICGGKCAAELASCSRQFAQTYLELEKKYLKVRSVCYIGKTVSLDQMSEEMEWLMRMDNTRLQNNGIAIHRTYSDPLPTDKDLEPKFERWSSLLKGGFFDKACEEIILYLNKQEENHWLNKRRFRYFIGRYTGMLNSYTEQMKYPLSQLTSDPESAQCFETSDRGLDYMRKWVHCSLTQLAKLSNSGNPISATKRYIEMHLTEELKVQQIADNVFLNPDYLTRIFKKETGVSIKSYIVNRRMEAARNLLETSELPIADVAYQVGYYNYTSFNRIFKKYYGESPQSFRQESD